MDVSSVPSTLPGFFSQRPLTPAPGNLMSSLPLLCPGIHIHIGHTLASTYTFSTQKKCWGDLFSFPPVFYVQNLVRTRISYLKSFA